MRVKGGEREKKREKGEREKERRRERKRKREFMKPKEREQNEQSERENEKNIKTQLIALRYSHHIIQDSFTLPDDPHLDMKTNKYLTALIIFYYPHRDLQVTSNYIND